MFDIGAIELLLVGMVALVIIGPKDLPIAMRTAGRWLGQLRAMTGHFRVGVDAMIREAEIEEQEKAWAEKNAQIMRDHPPEKSEKPQPADDAVMQSLDTQDVSADEEVPDEPEPEAAPRQEPSETQLPLLPDEPRGPDGVTKA